MKIKKNSENSGKSRKIWGLTYPVEVQNKQLHTLRQYFYRQFRKIVDFEHSFTNIYGLGYLPIFRPYQNRLVTQIFKQSQKALAQS